MQPCSDQKETKKRSVCEATELAKVRFTLVHGDSTEAINLLNARLVNLGFDACSSIYVHNTVEENNKSSESASDAVFRDVKKTNPAIEPRRSISYGLEQKGVDNSMGVIVRPRKVDNDDKESITLDFLNNFDPKPLPPLIS